MTHTVAVIDKFNGTMRLPDGLRPARIPPSVWERLHYHINAIEDRLEVFYGDNPEPWVTMPGAWLRGQPPQVDLGAVMVRKITHHYLLVHKPELLCC